MNSNQKNWGILLTGVLLLVAASTSAYADLVVNVQTTQEIVNDFNSLNNGRGYFHDPTQRRPTQLMHVSGGMVDTSAYASDLAGADFFRTFCVEPTIEVAYPGYATLNYTGGASVTSGGHYLSVGAAYLYSQFARGLVQEDYVGYLQESIRQLMGVYQTGPSWGSPSFTYLRDLLNINGDTSFWMAEYDPAQRYDVIGDYSVFVVNVANQYGVPGYQDFLYVAQNDFTTDVVDPDPTVTPEPASMLIFGVGLFGLEIARRKKQAKKQG